MNAVWKRMMFWTVIALGSLLLGVLTTVLLSWRRPDLGVVDGRLRPCGAAPNCVCSQAEDDLHGVEPFSRSERHDPIERLAQIMADWPGATLIVERPDYLRYECATPLLHYVDDVEFLRDADTGVIHVRSASRVGRSDLGANRRRILEIRRRYEARE